MNHFARPKPNDMPTQHAIGGGGGEDFRETLGVTHRPRAPVGGEREFSNGVGNPLGLQFFLALADRGDLWVRVDHVRNDAIIDVARLPCQQFGDRYSLVLRLMGEHRPADDVADRIDSSNVGGEMRVDDYLPTLRLDAERL